MSTADLRKRGLFLEYLTLGWNIFEGIAALTAGIVAHSVSLTAYGLDSALEVAASVDASLAGIVLLGLVANGLLGWWWTFGVAALILSLFALREGVQGLRAKAA